MSKFYEEMTKQVASAKMLAGQTVREKLSGIQAQLKDIKKNVEIGCLPPSSIKGYMDKQSWTTIKPIFEEYQNTIKNIHADAIAQYKEHVAINKRNLPNDVHAESMIMGMVANGLPMDNIINTMDRYLIVNANGIENACNIIASSVGLSEIEAMKIHQFKEKVDNTINVLTEANFLADLEAVAGLDEMVLRQSDLDNFALCPIAPGTAPDFVEVWGE